MSISKTQFILQKSLHFISFHLNIRYNCFYSLGQIEEISDFNKYEEFDPSLIEEVGAIFLYKVDQ
jgi:hypothetical protein